MHEVPIASLSEANSVRVYRILMGAMVVVSLAFSGCADPSYSGRSATAGSAALGQVADAGANLLADANKVLPKILLRIENNGEIKARLSVEVAKEDLDRQRGLMFRQELAEGTGMLFVFERPEMLSFWMKNTLIPLDMIFVDANHKILRIVEWAMPCKTDPCPSFGSLAKAQYVLEVGGGVSKKLDLQVGDELKW